MSFTPRSSGEALGTSMEMELLTNSIRNLNFLEGGGDEGTKRMELIFKLVASRTQAAAEERATRRAAWTEEARKVILERQLFQESGTTDLFPELVWEPILKKLEDPKDKAKLSGMAPLWRELLKKQRTTFLFNEVFAVFHAHGPPSRNAVMECRTVSREWKKSIDNRAQNFVYYPIRQVLQYRLLTLTEIYSMDELSLDLPVNPMLVALFLERSESASFPPYGNPFFSRKLRLCIVPHCREGYVAFWGEMTRLLSRWGQELWTMTFAFGTRDFMDAVGAYRIIRELLALMPNLRHLSILFQYGVENNDQVKICMKENPLPELPHLKSIVTMDTPFLMTKLMLDKYGPTLETSIAYQVTGNVYEDARLPNLKLMSLEPSHVFPLKMNWPSIQEFELKYENIAALALEIPKLFRKLGDVGGTLRKLTLILVSEKGSRAKLDAAAIRMLSLELPHLEEFSMTMDLGPGNLKTIDFILPMGKLKSLSLIFAKHTKPMKTGKRKTSTKLSTPEPGPSNQKGVPPGDGVIIKFWECTNRLYESNIWSLFPELRKVAITTFLVETRKSGGNHPGPGTPRGAVALTNTDIIKEVKYSREGYKRYLMKFYEVNLVKKEEVKRNVIVRGDVIED